MARATTEVMTDTSTTTSGGRRASVRGRRARFLALVAGIGVSSLAFGQCVATRTGIVFRSIEDFTSNAETTALTLYDFGIRVNIGTKSKDFPASLYADAIRCSANYVGTGVILTAAHCFKTEDASRDADGRLSWSISVKLSKTGVISGKCERPKQFREGEAYKEESLAWDWALCAVDGDPKQGAFEVISVAERRVKSKMEVLLTGFGIDPANKLNKPGGHMRVGQARIVGLTADAITTCGSSLDYGDSGAGTYLYFDKKFRHRVQVAVNSRKNDGVCDPKSPGAKSSSMLGLWRAAQFIEDWRTRHKRQLCGVHNGATNCRNPSLSTVTPAEANFGQ
jgi:hypothetical protein